MANSIKIIQCYVHSEDILDFTWFIQIFKSVLKFSFQHCDYNKQEDLIYSIIIHNAKHNNSFEAKLEAKKDQ